MDLARTPSAMIISKSPLLLPDTMARPTVVLVRRRLCSSMHTETEACDAAHALSTEGGYATSLH